MAHLIWVEWAINQFNSFKGINRIPLLIEAGFFFDQCLKRIAWPANKKWYQRLRLDGAPGKIVHCIAF